MKILKQAVYLILLGGIIFSSCKKYLDEKSNKKLAIPTTLGDRQALLDNYSKINASAQSPGESFSDDYYLTDADYASLTVETSRRLYTWQNSFLFDGYPNPWSICYNVVYYSNIALQGLSGIAETVNNQAAYDFLKGHALFLRGFSFYSVASLWCQTYDAATSSTDMGIPIRMTSDFNIASERVSLKATYDQIISDLKGSASLLPVTAVSPMRPSRPAAFAMLARVYLSMRDYTNAGIYADSSLQLYNKLIDYNSLTATASFPIATLNAEVVFENQMTISGNINSSRAKIDSVLFLQYAANDLRKTVFFKNNNNGSYSFKGSYEGSTALFGGLATDEAYLIRAECYARNGNTSAAMNDLNTLLVKRWKAGTFIPFTALNSAAALNIILTERRKEVLMRGLRWTDLKRFNKDGANINLKRIVNGQQYFLPANDLRYAMPIPEDVINLTGMPQNPK